MLQNQNATTVIDLFAGTGAVGYAMQDYKRIVSNDLEYYSYVVNQAILNGCKFDSQKKQNLYDTVKLHELRLSKLLKESIQIEKPYFRGCDMEGYKAFCEETPSIFNPQTSIQGLKPIEEFVNDIVPGVGPRQSCIPCLFLSYYANAYFGIRQCCEIDAMSRAGLVYRMQIPVPAPRKSFKTVMTPKGTLDGNYIVIFQKRAGREIPHTAWQVAHAQTAAVECAENIIRRNHHVTSQDLYDTGMLKDSIERGYLNTLSTKYSTFVDVIKNNFEFSNGYWRI